MKGEEGEGGGERERERKGERGKKQETDEQSREQFGMMNKEMEGRYRQGKHAHIRKADSS